MQFFFNLLRVFSAFRATSFEEARFITKFSLSLSLALDCLLFRDP